MKKEKLPRSMYFKHGAYYIVKRNKWFRLGKELKESLRAYTGFLETDSIADKYDLSEYIEKVLADVKQDVAQGTFKNYSSCARKFEKVFAEFSLDQIEPGHIAQFMDSMRSKPDSANLHHSFLNTFFTKLVRWGNLKSNPVKEIKKFKVDGRRRLINDEEFIAIRNEAEPRLKLLMEMALLTGQRIGDLLKIKYTDINSEGLHVIQKKTGNQVFIRRSVQLGEIEKAAKEICNVSNSDYLFHHTKKMKSTKPGDIISYGAMHHHWIFARTEATKKCPSLANDPPHFHDIRAKTGTELDDAGIDSKGLLGHASESSNKRYLRSKRVKKVMPHESHLLSRNTNTNQ